MMYIETTRVSCRFLRQKVCVEATPATAAPASTSASMALIGPASWIMLNVVNIYIYIWNKARFHNYVLTIPEPKPRDSTTKVPRFHNQTPTIPQPKSQDSTTKLSGFPRFFGKTTATYFHYTRFLTSYKAFKNHPPPQNNRSNLSLQQAAPLLWEDYRYLLSLYKILDKLQGI